MLEKYFFKTALAICEKEGGECSQFSVPKTPSLFQVDSFSETVAPTESMTRHYITSSDTRGNRISVIPHSVLLPCRGHVCTIQAVTGRYEYNPTYFDSSSRDIAYSYVTSDFFSFFLCGPTVSALDAGRSNSSAIVSSTYFLRRLSQVETEVTHNKFPAGTQLPC